MARQQLIADIRALDQLLARQQCQLQDNGQHRLDRLRQVSPLWLVAGGIAAGVVAGRLGRWLDSAAAGSSGFGALGAASLYSWGLGAMRLWSLYRSLQTGPAGPSLESDI